MNKKVFWITRTAVLLALLVVLQWLTQPLGQLVTGSCVNGVLAAAALFGGTGCGLTVALVSPVCAYLFRIAPQILVIPGIMLGNAAYVLLLSLVGGQNKSLWRNILGWLTGAVGKFGVLCVLIYFVFASILPPALTKLGWLNPAAQFGIVQLITALIGGAAVLAMLPVLKKAIKET